MEINNNSVHWLSGGIQGWRGSEWSIIMQCHLKEMMSAGWLRYTPCLRELQESLRTDFGPIGLLTIEWWICVYWRCPEVSRVSCSGGEMQSWINLRLNVKDATVCWECKSLMTLAGNVSPLYEDNNIWIVSFANVQIVGIEDSTR
jgi:hypothetical protein